MIEHLSKLDPQTSHYISSMQDSGRKILTERQQELRVAAKNCRCERCRGRRRVKEYRGLREDDGKPKIGKDGNQVVESDWVTCPRCFGGGRKLDGAHVSSATRSAPSTLSHEVIANLVQGMRPELYRAAVVKVTQDMAMQKLLIEDVRVGLVLDLSQAWSLSEDLRRVRCLGLARVAVHNLVHGGYARTNHATVLMCCTGQGWRKTWAERAEEITDRLEGWVVAADGYMYDQLLESLEEVETD